MGKLDVIREILNEKFLSKNQLALVENDRDNRGRIFSMTYPIIHGRMDYSLYRYHINDEDVFPYFNEIGGLKKMCDYILFAEEENYLYVFLIELKLGTISARKQLDSAKEFVNYIINTANRIGKEIDERVAYRKVRICHKKIKKRKTKEENVITYDNEYCDYPYKSLRLKHLTYY